MDTINDILDLLCRLCFLYVCYIIIIKLSTETKTANQETKTSTIQPPKIAPPSTFKQANELDPSVIAPFLCDPPTPNGGFGRQS